MFFSLTAYYVHYISSVSSILYKKNNQQRSDHTMVTVKSYSKSWMFNICASGVHMGVYQVSIGILPTCHYVQSFGAMIDREM